MSEPRQVICYHKRQPSHEAHELVSSSQPGRGSALPHSSQSSWPLPLSTVEWASFVIAPLFQERVCLFYSRFLCSSMSIFSFRMQMLKPNSNLIFWQKCCLCSLQQKLCEGEIICTCCMFQVWQLMVGVESMSSWSSVKRAKASLYFMQWPLHWVPHSLQEAPLNGRLISGTGSGRKARFCSSPSLQTGWTPPSSKQHWTINTYMLGTSLLMCFWCRSQVSFTLEYNTGFSFPNLILHPCFPLRTPWVRHFLLGTQNCLHL